MAHPEAPGACRSSARVFTTIGPPPGDGLPEETSRNRILSSAGLDRDLIATVEELPASDFLVRLQISTSLPSISNCTRFDPNAIAATYLDLHRQDKSAWSTEIDLRPFMETF
jgi:hypothetical protein